jgi:YVTN family beta-propeller protein
LFVGVVLSLFVSAARGNPLETGKISDPESDTFVGEGIRAKFIIEPVKDDLKPSVKLQEGEDARVQFTLTDAATGAALKGLRPAAWMSLRGKEQAPDAKACREMIQSFLQGSLAARPDIDLNTYYLLTLNQEPNISVIDPLMGYGGSKLLALIPLNAPGEDWALSSDRKRLFVTLPSSHQTAVVDTASWKVVTYVSDVGTTPMRIAFQPDGKYLWIGDDAANGGVTVIDAKDLKVTAHIPTGAGRHELAFTGDSRYAFVSNQHDATVSIMDVQTLAKVKDVKTGKRPASLAYSPLSKALYIVDEEEGSVTAVDGQSHTVLARVTLTPGLKAIRFSPGGRWGFVTNARGNRVHILDASTNQISHTIEAGPGPDQIAFTPQYAYIRSTGTEYVHMIQLNQLGKGEKVPVARFSGGQTPPGKASRLGISDTLAPAPEGNAVLVANPADKSIYYYTEGMVAPMGNFQNYGRVPQAVRVIDRSMQETEPGVYSTSVRLTQSGVHDVAFLLDSPRISHCFTATVESNPLLKKQETQPVRVEFLFKDKEIRVGETNRLQFKLTDPASHEPKGGLKDVRVLAFLSPGTWRKSELAQSVGEGVYEMALSVPRSGVYYIFVECPSLRVRYHELPHLILQALVEKSAGKGATEKTP